MLRVNLARLMFKDLMSMLDLPGQDPKCHQSDQFSQSQRVKLDQKLEARKAFFLPYQKQELLLKLRSGKLKILKIKSLLFKKMLQNNIVKKTPWKRLL